MTDQPTPQPGDAEGPDTDTPAETPAETGEDTEVAARELAPTRPERARAALGRVGSARAGLAVAVAAVVLGTAGVGFAVGHATAGDHDRHGGGGFHHDDRGAVEDRHGSGPGGQPPVPVQPPQPALPPEQSEGGTPSDQSSDQTSSLSLG